MQRLPEHSLLLVALVAVLGFASCGGGRSTTPGSSPSPRDGELAVELTDQQLENGGAQLAAEYPRAILADKRITFSEYEGAVLAMVACAAEGKAFLASGEPRLDAAGRYLLEFSWDPADYETASKAVEECGRAYLHPVQALWSQGRAGVVPESTITEAQELFWQCVVDAGIDMIGRPKDSSSLEYVFNAPEGLAIVTDCQERIFQQFGLANFGG